MQHTQRRVAQTALGKVDDPLEGEVVGRLGDDSQIGDGVADFLAFVEPQAADHTIGQAERDEAFFEFAGLKRRAHEDRRLGQPMPLALQGFDLVADHPGFLGSVPDAAHDHALAVVALGPQSFAEPSLIGGDQARSGAQNVRRGAVIAFQPDDPGARKIPLEPQNIADFRTPPAIDRLVVVADAADVVMLLGQQPQPQILRDIGVLILVHHDIFEPALIIGQHVRMPGEQRQAMQQQVAEIGRVQGFQALLIGLIQRFAASIGEFERVRVRELVGRLAAIFPAVDHRGEHPRRPAFFVQSGGLNDLFEQPKLVVGVENREIRLQSDHFGVAAQDLRTDGMESAEPRHSLGRAAHQPPDPVLHLSGRLVSERYGQQLARPGPPCRQQMSKTGRKNAGFSRACARKHENRAVNCFDGFALLRIQAFEIRGARLWTRILLGQAIDIKWIGHAPLYSIEHGRKREGAAIS